MKLPIHTWTSLVAPLNLMNWINYFIPHYNGCNSLSMLGLTLIHASKGAADRRFALSHSFMMSNRLLYNIHIYSLTFATVPVSCTAVPVACMISFKRAPKHAVIFAGYFCYLIIHLNLQVISLTLSVNTWCLATTKAIYHDYIWLARRRNLFTYLSPGRWDECGRYFRSLLESIIDGSRMVAVAIYWNLRHVKTVFNAI